MHSALQEALGELHRLHDERVERVRQVLAAQAAKVAAHRKALQQRFFCVPCQSLPIPSMAGLPQCGTELLKSLERLASVLITLLS